MSVWFYAHYFTRQEPIITDEHRVVKELLDAALDVGEDYGACHIVVEDINLETLHIKWCLDNVQTDNELTDEGRALLEALLKMSLRDRFIVFSLAEHTTVYTDEAWALVKDDFNFLIDIDDPKADTED